MLGLRIVFAAFLLVAGLGSCTGGVPETPVIVGTWEVELDLGPSAGKAIRSANPDATEAEVRAAMDAAVVQLRASGGIPRFTFAADGTTLMEGLVVDHLVSTAGQWELVDASTNRVAIRIWTADKPAKEPMVFAVGSQDSLTFAEGKMRGTRLARVK